MASTSEPKTEERQQALGRMRKEYTKRFYQEAAEARENGRRTVHMTALGPTELMHAMDFLPVIPENYATIACAKQMAKNFCETAEHHGAAHDLCSYYRCGLGMFHEKDGPLGEIPPADLVVGFTGLCDPYVKWWETWAREYDAPCFIFEMPFNFTGEMAPHELEWMVASLKRLVEFIESRGLGKFDEDRFREAVRLSVAALDRFWEVYELKKSVPCPRGLREGVGDLFYAVTALGKAAAVDYYTLLAEDMRERVARGEGVVGEEKFRLFWDNIPLWYRLNIIDYFSQRGAVFPTDGYIATIWLAPYLDGTELDPERPWEVVARRIWACMQNSSAAVNMRRYERLMRDWQCEGAVFFSNRSCIAITGVVVDKADFLMDRLHLPSISFQAEMADPRSFPEEDVMAQIEAFLELLTQR